MSEILILGDICPDNDYRRLFGSHPAGPFSEAVVQFVQGHAAVIANLECPATDSTRAITKTGPNIKALPKDVALLRNMGVNVLNLGNNHIRDYGSDGVIDTLETCAACGIATVGAGRDAAQAADLLIMDVDGVRVGVLSYAEEEFNLATECTPGANHFDPYTSLVQINRAKEAVDALVVLYHGGIEHYIYPSPELQKKCRAMVQMGADLVLCQHSHCIGTEEKYMGATILYGQGNTAFGFRPKDAAWNEGLALSFNPSTKELRHTLLTATKDGVDIASHGRTEARLKQLRMDSQRCAEPKWLAESWLRFCRGMAPLNLPLFYGHSKLYNRANRLLGNKLIDLSYSKTAQMISLELIRCEAHLEVMKTILEDQINFHTCQKYR